MSKGKYNGLTKKKQDARKESKAQKTKETAIAVALTSQQHQQRFIDEYADKHNKLASHVDEVMKQMAMECGKLYGNQQAFTDSNEAMDLNIICLAELTKVIYFQLEANSRLLEKLADKLVMTSEERGLDMEDVQKASSDRHAKAVAAAFTSARESIRLNAEKRAEQIAKAQEAREAARQEAAKLEEANKEAAAESDLAEKILRDAESTDLTNISTQPGGIGSSVPDGAQVFGG